MLRDSRKVRNCFVFTLGYQTMKLLQPSLIHLVQWWIIWYILIPIQMQRLNNPDQVKRPRKDTNQLKISFCWFGQCSDVAYLKRIWHVEYKYLYHTFPGKAEMGINIPRAFGWERRLENPTSTAMDRRQRPRNLQHNYLGQRRWKVEISASIREIWPIHEASKQPNLDEVPVKMSWAKQHTTGGIRYKGTMTRRWGSLQLAVSGDDAQGHTGVRNRLG